MVIEPTLSDADGFCPAVTVNAVPLAPDVRFSDSHEGQEDTDHDDWLVVGVKLTDPPAPGIAPGAGETARPAGIVAVIV
jgi:hypothetical protein